MTKTLIQAVFLFLLTLASSTIAFAQGEANVWIAPTLVGLNFNGGSPSAFATGTARGALNASNYEGEGCSSVSDSTGSLLFYTEGVNVYNKNNAVMTNGSGLKGNLSSTQSAIIVPCPAAPKRFYYVFCAPPEEKSASPGGSSTSIDGLTYSIVDMTLNGGLGDVTATKNVRITPVGEGATEGLTVVPNMAGDGFWIIGHQAGGLTGTSFNKFYIYGVNKAGITPATGVITTWTNASSSVGTSITGIVGTPNSGNGQVIIKSNSCFNKLAMSFFAKNPLIEIYNFSNSTGAISLANSVTNVINNQVYGLEFSPNGNFLYATILETNHQLYQFDISSGSNATINAAGSRTAWTPTGTTSLRWAQLQLGPDGKIYMAHHVDWNTIGSGSPHASIGVINSPNTGGTGANFVEQQITTTTLTGTGSKHGLPQFYKGFIAGVAKVSPGVGLAGLDQVCVGQPADFVATYTQTGTNWRWNIDANIGPNTTNEYFTQNITHTYATAGTYDVVLQLDDATCGYLVTQTTQIIVNPVYNAAGTISCSPVTGTVTSPDPTKTYVWYSDAAGTNVIASGSPVSLPVAGTGNVYLKATNGSSSTPIALTNGTAAAHPWGGSDPGTVHTMGFTVTKAPLTFGTFDWEAPYGAWAASNQNTTFTVEVKNSAGTVMYTNTRIVATNGPTWVSGYPFTENVNTALPLGNYTVVITATSGVGGPIKKTTPCTSGQTDAQSALTYGTSGVCGIAAAFNYTLTQFTTTPLYCSNLATIPFNCPLPVTFIGFNANRSSQSTGVTLSWSTATEQNAKAFYIQRSVDGVNFETVGEVAASGNSSSVLNYTYNDSNAPTSNLYYRIAEEDFDGVSMYSSIAYVNGVGLLNLSLVPNPGSGSFKIVGISDEEKLKVSVYSITGQSVYSSEVQAGEIVELGSLAKGFYVVRILVGNTEQAIRFINQ